MSLNLQTEKTFVIIKPDGVQRGLVGDIISRIEKTGLKLVTLKMTAVDEDTLYKHYNKDDEWYASKGAKVMSSMEKNNIPVTKEAIEYGKDIIRALVSYMTSGPVVMMVWEGNESVAIVRKIVGGTEPTTADIGTIRADYTLESIYLANMQNRAVRNLIHASEIVEDSTREIGLWLKAEEIMDYTHVQELLLYGEMFTGFKK